MKFLFIVKDTTSSTKSMLAISDAMKTANLQVGVVDYSTPIFDTLMHLQPDVVIIGEGTLTKAVVLWLHENPRPAIYFRSPNRTSSLEKDIDNLHVITPDTLLPAVNLLRHPRQDKEDIVVYHGSQDFAVWTALEALQYPYKIFGPTPWRAPEYLGDLGVLDAYDLGRYAYSHYLTDDAFCSIIQAAAIPIAPNSDHLNPLFKPHVRSDVPSAYEFQPIIPLINQHNYHVRAAEMLEFISLVEEKKAVLAAMESYTW